MGSAGGGSAYLRRPLILLPDDQMYIQNRIFAGIPKRESRREKSRPPARSNRMGLPTLLRPAGVPAVRFFFQRVRFYLTSLSLLFILPI